MTMIKQSTAVTLLVGPVLDSTGAAKTDEVVGNIKITKNGTVGGANGSATLTHDHAGKYKLVLTTSDTDTLGIMAVSLSSGTNDMPVIRFNVVTAVSYNIFCATSGGSLPNAAAGAAGGLGKSTNGIDLDNLPTATYLVQLIALLARNDAGAAADLSAVLAGINQNYGSGGGSYDPTARSLQAIPAAISVPTAAQNAAGLLDLADGVETGLTVRQHMRVAQAAAAGKADGLDGNTVHYRDKADSKDRITANVDANGNRTDVTLDLT